MLSHITKFISVAAFLSFVAMLTGCSGGSVSICADTDPCGWKQDESKTMIYNNSDTTSMRDIGLFISCSNDFNEIIQFEITTITPDSLRFSEKFLFNPTQTGNRNNFTVKHAPYRTGSIFSRSGGYVFRIRPLCDKPLKGIRAVGMEIVNSEKDKD